MKRLVIVLAVLAVAALGAFAVLRDEQPNWWVRLWYPLDYREVVVGTPASTTSTRRWWPR